MTTTDRNGRVLQDLRARVREVVFDPNTPAGLVAPLARQLHDFDRDDVDLLIELRDRVLEVIERSGTRDLAALSRRVRLLTADIEALGAERDDSDEMTAATSTPDEAWNGDASDL